MTAHATYAELTAAASQHLDDALSRAQSLVSSGPGQLAPAPDGGDAGSGATTGLIEGLPAHRDLTAALAHLGRTLSTRLRVAGKGAGRPPRTGPDARLIGQLDRTSAPRDWSMPEPVGELDQSLLSAARSIRAAADLWATHHTPSGVPRSPEASRLRHPSVLGAATREWRALISTAADIAGRLTVLAQTAGPLDPDTEAVLRALSDYPRPLAVWDGGLGRSVEVTVARPAARRGTDPLEGIAELVGRIRRNAWAMAESGTAPATVLANAAAIGLMLNRATAAAHEAAASSSHAGATREGHLEAARAAGATADRWAHVTVATSALRSAHPSAAAIQIERLDLARLLEHASSRRAKAAPAETAWALSRAADAYGEVAEFHLRALRGAHSRGDVLLTGRGLPSEALSRRPDLLHAKLTNRVIVAPNAVLRQLEIAYRAVGSERGRGLRGGTTPAA